MSDTGTNKPPVGRALLAVLEYALTFLDIGLILGAVWGWLPGRSSDSMVLIFSVMVFKMFVTAYYAKVCCICNISN